MRVSLSFDLSRTRAWLGADTPAVVTRGRVVNRAVAAVAAVASLVGGAACTSSSTSTSVTSPTSVRCPVDLALTPATIDATGGSGQITIAVNRECTWEARSEADWIALGAPTSGQGEANLGFTAAANAVVSARRGTVVVNDQRIEVAQAAAACRFELSDPGGSVAATGGNLAVSVTAQATCVWTAASEVDWVRVESGREGSGQGVVTMTVAPNTGAARQGTILVAGQRYSVSQAATLPPGTPTPPTPPPPTTPPPTTPPPAPPACAVTVSPDSQAFGTNGGDGTVRVQASASNCAWTAVSNVPWITIADAGGSGNGNARYVVAPNPGAARTGTLTVAGVTVTVTQAAAPAPPTCEFNVSPDSESFGANGGEGSVRVRPSASNCAWTAVSNVPWITMTAPGGSGNGDARYVVAPNSGGARTGIITVAGAAISVNQAAAPVCAFTVTPQTESFPASGGESTVRVEASASTCAWTAVSSVPWLTLASAGGTGSGNVRYSVALNAGAARAGTLAVAGATVTVTQAAAFSVVLRGEVSALTGQCPTVTFALSGSAVRTTAATDFETRCERLRNGRDFTVWGVAQADGSVLALRVREGDDD